MPNTITRAEVLHELGIILAGLRDDREQKRQRKESIDDTELIIERLQTGYDFLVANFPVDRFPPRPQ